MSVTTEGTKEEEEEEYVEEDELELLEDGVPEHAE